MKNNLIITLLIYLFLNSNVFSNSFTLESKNIKILNNGEQINSDKGVAISSDGNLKVKSDQFIYLKNLDMLQSNGNSELLVKSKKIKIKYDSGVLDQRNMNFTADGNVEIFQTDGVLVIKTNKIFLIKKKILYYQMKLQKLKIISQYLFL